MLKGKTILITGSSRGIGAAIARCAHAYGAKVILHGRTETPELLKLALDLTTPYCHFDVTDAEAVNREVAKCGRIDVLINNAGINPSDPPGTFENLTIETWRHLIEVDLLGQMNVIRAVLDGMKERKSGVIIDIASVKGFTFVGGKVGYATVKGAFIQFTTRMAQEYAKKGIRFNTVAPGFTDTELTQKTLKDEEAAGKLDLKTQIAKIPLQRMGRTEEIAEAVVFLASDKASYITGQTLAVDGGLSIV